jgi:histidine ammonia-lyase
MSQVVVSSASDLTLDLAARVAFDGATIELSPAAEALIEAGRSRFERYLDRQGGYVYGSTTAPGSRATVTLSADAARRQGSTLREFIAVRAGTGGALLPQRCVRLAVLARLSNALTGSGKLAAGTVRAVADLLPDPPPVPLQGVASSGEVMALTWLLAPLADRPLGVGEAMALINGSPFATATACDVALTFARRVGIAEHVFALSADAAGAPREHFDPRLAQRWLDPHYGEALRRFGDLLAPSPARTLDHQAPTSWRVIPNVLAAALQALDEVNRAAEIGLMSLKDNPTFLVDDTDPDSDQVVSSGGYLDLRAAKAIDRVTSVLVDVCVLASRQVSRFLDGVGLGLPALLAAPGDRVGLEFLAWSLTEPLAAARAAAVATTLDLGVHDPAGNQSDVPGLAFLAYAKHLQATRAVDDCLAALAVTAVLALDLGRQTPPDTAFCRELLTATGTRTDRVDVVGAPLRLVRDLIREIAEDRNTPDVAHPLGSSELGPDNA